MVIRAILFDWDGTLVRNHGSTLASPASAVTEYARRELGMEAGEDDFGQAFRAVFLAYESGKAHTAPAIEALIAAAFARLGWRTRADDVDACARLFFAEMCAGLQVYDDARALLASLKFRGYRMGVVTNAIFRGTLFEPKTRELGLAGYIDAFVSSADLGIGKPNPAIYRHALECVGVAAEEALFVGDRVDTDIAGAIASGIGAVLIAREARAREDGGYAVIERLSALNRVVGENPV